MTLAAAGALVSLTSALSSTIAAASETQQDAAPQSCSISGAVPPICGVHVPEDIELLPDGRVLLIREFPEHFDHPARGLMIVDLTTDRVRPLTSSNKLEAGWGDATCTAPPAQIGSHGIHLAKLRKGCWELLVVNHAVRESIETLELVHNEAGYRSIWRGCVVNPTDLLNAVSATFD